ncbi:MAG: hypothetical protein ACI39E_02225 [Acutalibacteraceae bacterium]
MKKQLIALLLAAALFLSAMPLMTAAENNKMTDAYESTASYMTSTVPAPTFGNEWAVIGLSRGGCKTPDGYYEQYYEKVVSYVADNIDENGRLDSSRSTENSRLILALTAIGKNPRDVGGHNLLLALSDLSYIEKQGLSGPVYALIALDSNRYSIPAASDETAQTTRDALIAYILENKLESGGWTFFGSSADPDMTGMALQALAPYYNTDSDVKAAVDEALWVLSDMQETDGGFASWGTVNSASCAQVVAALTALGIDPAADGRFVKENGSAVDALLNDAVEDGGFSYAGDGTVDQMSTEQAFYALVSYLRVTNGQTSLYNMTDLYIGDIDGSGAIDLADSYKLYLYASAVYTLTEGELLRADIDRSGTVDIADSMILYRFASGKLASL